MEIKQIDKYKFLIITDILDCHNDCVEIEAEKLDKKIWLFRYNRIDCDNSECKIEIKSSIAREKRENERMDSIGEALYSILFLIMYDTVARYCSCESNEEDRNCVSCDWHYSLHFDNDFYMDHQGHFNDIYGELKKIL